MMRKKDCCCNDWKNMIKQLWEKYQGTVRVVSWYGKYNYPDGDGVVVMPPVQLKAGIGLIDQSTYWTLLAPDSGEARIINNVTYYTLEIEA